MIDTAAGLFQSILKISLIITAQHISSSAVACGGFKFNGHHRAAHTTSFTLSLFNALTIS